jgi:hypothetical protein
VKANPIENRYIEMLNGLFGEELKKIDEMRTTPTPNSDGSLVTA